MKTIVAAAIAALIIGAVAVPAYAAGAPYLVKNINAGSADSWPAGLSALGDLVIFTASGGGAGREVWRSDGTAAGTYRLRDIRPGGKTSYPRGLTTVGGRVFFSANDGPHGQELWVTDGTTAGTHMVKDIAPGTDSYLWAGDDSPIAVDVAGVAFFNDTASNGPLWRSDGTEAGTYQVPGSPEFASQLTAFNNRVYFSAKGKLWRSDGTAQGTKKVISSTGKVVKAPVEMVASDSMLFFQYESTKLWRTDGTRAGTYKILDNGPGCIGSLCDPTYLTAAGDLVFFMPHGVPGIQVWRSDGTPSGTFSVAQTDSGGSDMFHAVGDLMYILIGDVWVSDGSVEGTRVVDLPSGMAVWWVFDVAGELYYGALADGDSMPTLFSSDGTAEGTVQVGPPRPGFPYELTVAGDRVYFRGQDARGAELWAMTL